MTDRMRTALMLAPALLVTGGLFFGALAIAALRSLKITPGALPAWGGVGPSLDAYRAVLAGSGFAASLGLSLYIAVVSTVLSAVIAVGVAVLLRRPVAGRGVVLFLMRLGLTVPHAVGAVGILYLVSQSGTFARLAFATGVIGAPADFPAMVYDPRAVGIILHYVWKEVPFITLVVLARMGAVGEDYEAVARSLGAGRWSAFRFVLLPLILPSLLAASAIVLAYAFGAYEVPLLLGASQPQALPVIVYRLYTDADLAARPQAMALAMMIAGMSAGMVALYLRAMRALGT